MVKWEQMQSVGPNTLTNFLWFNSEIPVQNKPIYWENAYVCGLKFVSQLYHDGSLRSHKDITGTFGLTVMQTNSLLAAIPGYIRHPYVKSRIPEEIVMESVTSRKAYQNIITNRTYAFAKFEKWQVILNDLFDFDEYLVCYRDITLTGRERLIRTWLIRSST